jgi:hypothetical protein
MFQSAKYSIGMPGWHSGAPGGFMGTIICGIIIG